MNTLLYGHSTEKNIVAVQHINDNQMRVYYRHDGGVSSNDFDFYPFLLLANPSYLDKFAYKFWIKELAGDHYYRYIAAFQRWSDMWEAIHYIISRYNEMSHEKADSYADLPILYLRPDAISQFFLQSGRTLFKGMRFDELHRLQWKIVHYSKFGYKDNDFGRTDNRVIIIALSDNKGWEHVIYGKRKPEREMLLELVKTIEEKNPDIIEGHNILNFDLPYLINRCELNEIEFLIGRNNTSPKSLDPRQSLFDRSTDYPMYEIPGRHIIDTLQLIQTYDSAKNIFESYNLKYLTERLGIGKPDRVQIQADRIPWYWDNQSDLLLRYSKENLQDIRNLSARLSQGLFYLAQILPLSYAALARTTSPQKIELLILREYIRQKHSVPKPAIAVQAGSGYSEIFNTGIFKRIIQIDIELLYPAIILNNKIAPKTDTLNLFLPLLEELVKKLPHAMRNSESTSLSDIIYQIPLKTLTDSFYSYLIYSRGSFNDPLAASKVSLIAQNLLKQIFDSIIFKKGQIIALDNNSIFFLLPENIKNKKDENKFVRNISKDLPFGINIRISGRYKVILSYKNNNYALLTYDNQVKIKGSSLISRNIEKYGRYFLQLCINALLNEDINGLHEIYLKFYKNINEHKISVIDFARTETLKDSIEKYSEEIQKEKRNKMASYEAAITSAKKWKPGDRVTFYITGNEANIKEFENCKLAEYWDPDSPDENSSYYLKRLSDFAKRFEIFFNPEDFHAIFSPDDLFVFSPKGRNVLNLPVPRKIEVEEEEISENFQIIPKIWLDEE